MCQIPIGNGLPFVITDPDVPDMSDSQCQGCGHELLEKPARACSGFGIQLVIFRPNEDTSMDMIQVCQIPGLPM